MYIYIYVGLSTRVLENIYISQYAHPPPAHSAGFPSWWRKSCKLYIYSKGLCSNSSRKYSNGQLRSISEPLKRNKTVCKHSMFKIQSSLRHSNLPYTPAHRTRSRSARHPQWPVKQEAHASVFLCENRYLIYNFKFQRNKSSIYCKNLPSQFLNWDSSHLSPKNVQNQHF